MEPDHKIGLLSAVFIAVISGLMIKVIGDPLVEVTAPKLEDFFENVEESWEDLRETFEDSQEDASNRNRYQRLR